MSTPLNYGTDAPSPGARARRAALRLLGAAAILAVGLVTGWLLGYLQGQGSLYRILYEERAHRVRAVLNRHGDKFGGMTLDKQSRGGVVLFGAVASQADYDQLKAEMVRLLGEKDADLAMAGVEVAGLPASQPIRPNAP